MQKRHTYIQTPSGVLLAVLGEPEITSKIVGDRLEVTFRQPVLWQRSSIPGTADNAGSGKDIEILHVQKEDTQ